MYHPSHISLSLSLSTLNIVLNEFCGLSLTLWSYLHVKQLTFKRMCVNGAYTLLLAVICTMMLQFRDLNGTHEWNTRPFMNSRTYAGGR